nr:MAG TPA: hypothetical protein [Caudoviricetes sp.]
MKKPYERSCGFYFALIIWIRGCFLLVSYLLRDRYPLGAYDFIHSR